MAAVLHQLALLRERFENPVMERELRSRMRGGRSYLITGGYTLLVGICVLIVYSQVPATASALAMGEVASRTGRAIWTWGCCVQAVLLPLMVPAFTCGAITLERERDLLELLLLTRQSPAQICLGKLGSGAGLGLMLVFASVPVLSLSVVLGGVAPMEMVATVCVLTSGVVAAGALGLVVSSLCMRTMNATWIAYLIAGGAIVGFPVITSLMGQARAMQETGSEWAVLVTLLAFIFAALPPAAALSLVTSRIGRKPGAEPRSRVWWLATIGGWWCLFALLMYVPPVQAVLFQGQLLTFFHPISAILGVMEPGYARSNPVIPHLWWMCSLLYLGLAAWFILVATLRVRALRSA